MRGALSRLLRREVARLTLFKTLACGREAIPELRFREPVVEAIGRAVRMGGLHIGGEAARARRLPTLRQHERQRQKCRQRGEPAPSLRAIGLLRAIGSLGAIGMSGFSRRGAHGVRRIRCTRAMTALEFRTRPDHPPIAPRFNGDVFQRAGV